MRVRTVSLHWSGSPAWRRRASAKFGRADEADLDRRRGASDRPVRRNLAALKRQAGDLALAAAISHSSPARPARRCVRHHYDASKKKGPSHHIATGFSDNKGAPRPKADAAALSGIFAVASRHRIEIAGATTF